MFKSRRMFLMSENAHTAFSAFLWFLLLLLLFHPLFVLMAFFNLFFFSSVGAVSISLREALCPAYLHESFCINEVELSIDPPSVCAFLLNLSKCTCTCVICKVKCLGSSVRCSVGGSATSPKQNKETKKHFCEHTARAAL